MAVVCSVLGLLFLGSLVMLIVTLLQGHGEWGILFPLLMGAFGVVYTFRLSRDEYLATQLRKLRGSPKPSSSGSVDINLLELGQNRGDQPGASR